MADEVTITAGLQVVKRNSNNDVLIQFQGQPQSYRGDLTGAFGPVGGAVLAHFTGTIIDLSSLTTPGYYHISSQDDSADADDNYIEYGLYDAQTDVFYPWGELAPGEPASGKFSRNFLEEYTSTGSATTGPTNKLMVKSSSGSRKCLVQVFEK